MAVMMGSLHAAIVKAGAPEDDARKSAEEIAAYDDRFAKPEADVGRLKWMVGFNTGLTLLIAGLVLRIGGVR